MSTIIPTASAVLSKPVIAATVPVAAMVAVGAIGLVSVAEALAFRYSLVAAGVLVFMEA